MGSCDNLYIRSKELPGSLRFAIPGRLFRVCRPFLSQSIHGNQITHPIPRSGFYPGIHYMLGSWYKPQEIGKRAMIFWLAGSVGSLFSGFLQSAAYTNLNGTNGYAGCMYCIRVQRSKPLD